MGEPLRPVITLDSGSIKKTFPLFELEEAGGKLHMRSVEKVFNLAIVELDNVVEGSDERGARN